MSNLRNIIESIIKVQNYCQQTKHKRYKYYRHLDPLHLLAQLLDRISMDFIIQLPKSKNRSKHIWVIMNWFIKIAYFLAISDIKAPELAKTFLKEIYQLHSIPEDIIFNCNSRSIGKFWSSILKILTIKKKLSIVFHLDINI